MDYDKIFRTVLPAAGLMAAGIASWYFRPSQLRSDRPPGAVASLVDPTGTQTLEARLWQDPFEPLRGLHKASEKLAGEWQQPLLRLRHELDKAGEDVCVAIVFLSNDRTINDAETRQRVRLAFLAAMGQRNYVPHDSQRLGWIAVPWQRTSLANEDAGASAEPDPEHPLLASFEWLEPPHRAAFDRNRDYDHVLVLWVDEGDFPDHPAARLAQLSDALGRKTRGRGAPFGLKVFGPRSSSGLVALCEEAPIDQSPHGTWFEPLQLVEDDGATLEVAGHCVERLRMWDVLREVEIYSTWATVTDALLPPYASAAAQEGGTSGRGLADYQRGRPALARAIARATCSQGLAGAEFHSLTCTDDQLLAALRREMALRHVPDTARDSIVLLSEWHSDYGRALPLTFAALQHGAAEAADPAGLIRAVQASPKHFFSENLIRLSYVSGVDGVLPAQKGEGEEKDKGDKGKESRDWQEIIPASGYRPEGNGQLDYVERLSITLSDSKDGIRPAAIGVLGSDVYDKLILLQALRERFPDACFFTTDLDARLAQPRLAKWTRNLLVASSFGLDPIYAEKSALPAFRVPPFRDSYQTALHAAATLAFGRSHPGKRTPGDDGEKDLIDVKARLTPHVFEIGRTEAIELPEVPVVSGDREIWRGRQAKTSLVVGLVLCLMVGRISLPRGLFAQEKQPPRGSESGEASGTAAVGLARYVPWLAALLRRNPRWWWAVGGLAVLTVLYLFGPDIAVMPVGLMLAAVLAFWRPQRSRGALGGGLFLLGLLVMAGLGALILFFRDGGQLAEPFRWLEGASVWPAEIVRLAATALGLYWLVKLLRQFEESLERTEDKFHLKGTGEGKMPELMRGKPPIEAARVWKEFCEHMETTRLMKRCGWWSAGMFLLWVFFIAVQNRAPLPPTRGELAAFVDITLLAGVVAIFTILSVLVIDVVVHARRMLLALSKQPSMWPQALLEKERVRSGVPTCYLDGWLDVRFAGRVTESVGKFVYYPLVVLFLIIVSAHPLVDRWDIFRPDLVLLLVISGAVPIACGWALCRAADEIRQTAFSELRMARIACLGTDSATADKLEAIVERVTSYDRGAFKSFWEQPYILALLVPLTGTSSLGFLQGLLEK